jgi:FkbM family methyltransferase
MPVSYKQKLVKFLLDIYLYPVRINNRLKRFVQEVNLIDTEAHLHKPIKYLTAKKILSKNPVIIDVGAAHGDTTAYFLKLIPGCQVYNFEANPDLAAEIKKRFANQPVKTYPVALSDKADKLTFHIADNEFSSSYKEYNDNEQFQNIKSVDVDAIPLDTIMNEENSVNEIDILKLDVQGAELDVLRGANQTLKKTKMLIVEQSVDSPYIGGSKYYEVDNFLRDSGFDLLDIVITYRKDGLVLTEFDSIYIQKKYKN